MFRHLLKIFSFLIFALVFSILGSIALDKAKAWVEAPAAPPGYGLPGCTSPCEANDFKAISRGSVDEYKTGKLGILNAGDYINYGLTVGNSASNIGSIKAENSSATPTGYFANYGSGPAIQLGAGGIKFSDGSTQNTSVSVWASNGNDIYNTNTGNVGIGTTSPSSPLSIANGDGTYGGLWVGQGTGKGWIYYGNSATDWKVGKMNTTTNNFEIRHHDDTSYLAVTPTGNVGIGTTSPAEKLEVIGTIRQAGASADGTTGIHIGDSAVRLFQTNDGNKSLGISTNATEKVRILGNGNVGIGTPTPLAKLDVFNTGGNDYERVMVSVNGNFPKIYFGNGLAYNSYIGYNYAGNEAMVLNSRNDVSHYEFQIAGFEKVRIDSAGNVGIGATTPTVKLEVAGEAKFGIATDPQQAISVQGSNAGTNLISAASESASLDLTNLNGGANTFASVKFIDAGGNYVAGISGVFIDDTNNRGELAFITRNGANINERMRIDRNGNIGIRTTTPAYPLDIRNPNNAGTAITRLNQDNATKLWTGTVLARQGVEKWFIGMNNGADNLLFRRNGTSDDMSIDNSNGNVTIANLCLSGVCNSSWPSAVNYWTKTGNDISNNNAGNVGIGTASPGSIKLLVDYNSANNLVGKFTNANASGYGLEVSLPNATGSGQNVFNLNTGVGSVMVVRNDGYVGIGTPAPLAKLDVYRGSGSNVYDRVMADVSTASFPKIYFGNGLAFNSYIGYDYPGNERMVLNSRNDTSHYEFQIAGSEKVRIDSNGSIGIRTTTPAYPLDIRNPNNAGTAITRLNQDNATKLWTGTVLARQGVEKWFIGMNNGADNLLFRRNGTSDDMSIDNSNGNVTIANLCLSGVCNSSWPSAVNYWTKTGNDISNNNAGNVGIGTASPGTVKLYTQSSQSGDWASVIKNTTAGGYGLSVDCSACVNNTYGLAVYTGVGTGMFVKNDTGNVGIGTTDPKAKLSFAELNDGRDTADGITWYNPGPTSYGIHRTSGPWSAPNYQQLRLSWDTGIILDPGKDYGKSYVEIAQGGLRVTSGNVGIGTPNPAEKLEVTGTIRQAGASADGTTGIHIGDSAVRLFQTNDGNKSLGIYTNATEKVRILGNGKVGIGTDTPNYKLEVKGSSAYDSVSLDPSTLNFGKIQFSTLGSYIGYDYNGLERMVLNSRNTDSHYEFQIAGSEKVRIDSAGNVGIGTSPGTYKLYVAGDIYTNTSGTSVGGWFTSSDARLKKNVETLSGSLDKIGRIRGVSYNLVDGSPDRQIGVIAQELEQEFPELVKTDDKGYKSVSYDKLSAVLIESVKELKSQNQTLQQRLDILEKRQ